MCLPIHLFPKDFREDTSLVQKVSQALQVDWFQEFSEMLYVVCYQVGIEARWLEGCACHEDLLKSMSWRKRARAMRDATSAACRCCWKGKRLPWFAMGYITEVCARVRAATSIRYRQVLLKAPKLVSARMAVCDRVVKTHWSGVVADKLAYAEHIPHKVTAAFSQYCGYPLAECKAKVRECVDEYRSIGNPS